VRDGQVGDVAESIGFNGADPIRETLAPGNLAAGAAPDPPRNAAERTAMRAERALNGPRLFAEFTFPLFAASFSGFPLEISDYSVSNGLNWPRKLKASFNDGALNVFDFRLSRFALNPKIDPKSFSPSR